MTALHYASLIVTYATVCVTWPGMVLYHRLTRGSWRDTAVGVHLMALAGVDAAIFSMLLLAVWWPVLALVGWYQWAYVASVAGIPVVNVWRTVILWRLYHPSKGAQPMPIRRPLVAHPLLVWQAVMAGTQVVNGTLLGSLKLALLAGAVQVALVFYQHGRASATTKESL